MGKASTDVGGFIGNVFTATLGRSCLNVCSETWDLACFIEHFCVPDIANAKLVLISGLCFIILMFITLLFKLGMSQCVVKSIGKIKMSCAVCATYWFAIGEMCRNTKRRRNRLGDTEAAIYDHPSDNDSSSSSYSLSHISDTTRPKQRKRRRRRLGSKHKHRALSFPDISFISSGRPSVELSGRTSRMSTSSEQSTGSHCLGIKFSDPGFPNEESGTTSSYPSQSLDVEAEMKRLRLELKQTMDMYSSACREAVSARQEATELQNLRTKEEIRLEEAKSSEELAMEIVEKERAKAKRRFTAEMMTLKESDSFSRGSEDVEAQMIRLRLELKATMDMYSTACKEALSARQQEMELKNLRTQEERRLEEAKSSEESAKERA